MKKIFRLVSVLLLLGGWALAGSALHVVSAPERLIVVPKNHLTFNDTFVNIKNWKIEDVSAHPMLVKRLIERGKADALQQVATDVSGEQLVEKLSSAVSAAPPATQPAAVSIRLER